MRLLFAAVSVAIALSGPCNAATQPSLPERKTRSLKLRERGRFVDSSPCAPTAFSISTSRASDGFNDENSANRAISKAMAAKGGGQGQVEQGGSSTLRRVKVLSLFFLWYMLNIYYNIVNKKVL